MPTTKECINCGATYNPQAVMSCPSCFFSEKMPKPKPKPIPVNNDPPGTVSSLKIKLGDFEEIKIVKLKNVKPETLKSIESDERFMPLPVDFPKNLNAKTRGVIRNEVYQYLMAEGFEMNPDRRKKLKLILKKF